MQKTSLEDDEWADQQRRLGDAREVFAAHAALYVLVMAALLVLNLFLTGFWWSSCWSAGGSSWPSTTRILRRVGTADAGRQRGTGRGPDPSGRPLDPRNVKAPDELMSEAVIDRLASDRG